MNGVLCVWYERVQAKYRLATATFSCTVFQVVKRSLEKGTSPMLVVFVMLGLYTDIYFFPILPGKSCKYASLLDS